MAFAIALAGGTATADAKPRHKHKHKQHHAKPASFDGSCEFTGAVTFTPPMTTTPRPTAQHANALGACTGTFVDHAGRTHDLNSAAVTYRAESAGDAVSCAFGTASGAGTLTFAAGKLAFVMHEYRAAAAPLIRLDGKNGGGAWMPVTPSQSSDPAAAVTACSGSGLERFDLDAHLVTDGPMRG
jgi:hypothetical protein